MWKILKAEFKYFTMFYIFTLVLIGGTYLHRFIPKNSRFRLYVGVFLFFSWIFIFAVFGLLRFWEKRDYKLRLLPVKLTKIPISRIIFLAGPWMFMIIILLSLSWILDTREFAGFVTTLNLYLFGFIMLIILYDIYNSISSKNMLTKFFLTAAAGMILVIIRNELIAVVGDYGVSLYNRDFRRIILLTETANIVLLIVMSVFSVFTFRWRRVYLS